MSEIEKRVKALKKWDKKDILQLYKLIVELNILTDGQLDSHISPDEIPTTHLPYWASLKGVYAMDEEGRVLMEAGKGKWKVVDKSELPAPKNLLLTEHKTLGGKGELPFSFRLTHKMKDLIEDAAKEHGVSASSWVRAVVAEKLIEEGYVDERE